MVFLSSVSIILLSMVLSFKGRTCGCESLDLQRPTRDRDAHAADYSANERARNLSVIATGIADKGQIPNDWWPHKMRVEYSTAYRPIVILQTKETKAVRINTFFFQTRCTLQPFIFTVKPN